MAYGYLPLMISAGCVRKTLGNCKKESGYTTITDRYRKEFVVQNNCEECYNILYNADPLYLGDQMEEIKALGPESLRLLLFFRRDPRPLCIRSSVRLRRRSAARFTGEKTRSFCSTASRAAERRKSI